MSQMNSHAFQDVAAMDAPVAEKAAFLQRTYSLLLAGILAFAATLWAAGSVPVVASMARGLWSMGWIGCMLVIMGGGYAVRALASKTPINLIAYFAYVFLFGLLLAPLVLFAAQMEGVLSQASMVTALVFTGLTGYVFISGKDFSFIGGICSIGCMALLGCLLAGWLFGFDLGLWFSVLGVLIFSGMVLYDTSRVLHHYPTTAHVRAAIELFVSLIILFQYVVMMLVNLNRD
ncbi:MAG: Bax inhibitor-1 family protein [Planctomycetota bacterium]|nr:Bax inhibitor-1 family protein [Planctomycetota bacterium]